MIKTDVQHILKHDGASEIADTDVIAEKIATKHEIGFRDWR